MEGTVTETAKPFRWASVFFAPGLMMALVYDLPTSVATVHPEHAETWPVSEGELMATALSRRSFLKGVAAGSLIVVLPTIIMGLSFMLLRF